MKVTRPQADLSRESLAHRVELLEARGPGHAAHEPAPPAAATARPTAPPPAPPAAPQASAPTVELEQVTEAWDRSIIDAVRERSIPVASLLTEAKPTDLADDTLTLEFPAGADFHRRQVGEPQNIGLLREALYEVTGRRLAVVLESGDEEDAPVADEEPPDEDSFIAALKNTFDAEEVEARDE